MTTTLKLRWDGAELNLTNDADRRWCKANFLVGTVHLLEPIFPRDQKLNKAKFATLNEAFKQLPHKWDEMFRNVNHFRKYLMVAEGFCDTEYLTFADEFSAKKTMLFLKRGHEDNPNDRDFAIVRQVNDTVLTVSTPWSMSEKSMPAKTFRECMNTITERAAHMIGVSVDELRERAKSSPN